MYFAESGLLRKAAYGNGSTREYEYDRQGRVKKMIIDGVERFSYTYDSQGNLLSYTDLVANEKFTYVYDFLGRPVQVRTSSGFKIKLTYDEFNRASDVEFVNGSESNKTSWVFGNDSIVTGVKYNGVEKISYTYDLLKRQTAKTINTTNPFVTQYQYKNIDNYRTSTLIDKISYSDGTALSYTYDANGNILTISDISGNIVASYTYDNLNQLTGATVGSDVYVYTYDNGGNITAKTKNGVEVAYTYGNTEWKDLLTNYNSVDIAYDTIGNPLNWINGEQFTWGGGRQLTGIVKGNDTISYTYNDSGIRTSKTINGVRTDYYLNGTAIIMQKAGDNVIWYTYDENGLKTGFTYNGTAYYYVYNLQGDVIALLNSAGETVARYDYDPWGKILAITDGNGVDVSSNSAHIANVNPTRYRGYYYDTETGLYYVSSRYYDPEVGRFISPDTTDVLTATPVGLTDKNLYAYCDNNPVVRVDHGGQFWETVFDVISLGASIVEVCINPKDPWAWAGLVGDAIDLIPFVTGVGEVTRAVKTIDKVTDTVQIAKAVDFTDDAADIVKTLDRSSGFTKSTASAGRKIHAGYKATDNFSSIGKEYRRINGIRPDYIDFNTRTIYELKPMNPRGVRSGIRQLKKYNKDLGGGFNLRLELY